MLEMKVLCTHFVQLRIAKVKSLSLSVLYSTSAGTTMYALSWAVLMREARIITG